jgi:hypothetical protein
MMTTLMQFKTETRLGLSYEEVDSDRKVVAARSDVQSSGFWILISDF